MAITKYYKSFDGQDIEVKQSGEFLTTSEESALRNQLGGDFEEISKPTNLQKDTISKGPGGAPKIYTEGGRFRGADYKSGVTNNRFRAGFANTNNFNEKINFLDKSIGSKGYVVDKQQNFLLTPEGQKVLGVESETQNLLAIDSDKFEGEDFIDLIGEVGAPMIASIAGSYAGMTAAGALLGGAVPALLPIVGFSGLFTRMAVGAATTGGAAAVGTLVDEGQQWMRGISEEVASDVFARAGREAGFAAVGETLGLGFSRLLGRGIKGGPKFGSGAEGRAADEALRVKYRDTLDKGFIPSYYGKGSPGENKPLTYRATQIAQKVFSTQDKIDVKNEATLIKKLKEVIGEGGTSGDNLTDGQILKIVKDASSDFENILKGDVEEFRDILGYKIGLSLEEINKSIIDGTEKSGLNWYDDLWNHYSELQDYVAVTSTVAFDHAEKRAFQIFEKLKPSIEKSLTKLESPTLPDDFVPKKSGKYPEGFNEKGVPQFEELNAEIKRLEAKKTLSAPEQNTLNYLKNLEGTSIPNVNSVPAVRAETPTREIITPAFNRTTRQPLNVLNNAEGAPIFAYELDEASQQIKYILPTNLMREVQNFKNIMGNSLRLNEGPLKTLYDLPPEANILMSPTEMNAVVQQMRKITIAADGERFSPVAMWDAALDDLNVSNAQLAGVARLPSMPKPKPTAAQQARLDDLPKGSKVYKDALKEIEETGPIAQFNEAAPVLKALEDYATQARQITQDNKTAFDLFEKTNITALADQYAAGKASATPAIMFNRLVQSGEPQHLENFLDAIEKIKRRKDRTIYTRSIAGEEAGDLTPIDTLNKPSKVARQVFETEFEAAEEVIDGVRTPVLAEITRTGGPRGRSTGLRRPINDTAGADNLPGQELSEGSTNIAAQTDRMGRLNQIDAASPKELREIVRKDLYRMFLQQLDPTDETGRVVTSAGTMQKLGAFADDILRKSTAPTTNAKGSPKKTILQMLTGSDKEADQWVRFARAVKDSPDAADSFVNVSVKKEIAELADKSPQDMTKLVSNIEDNIAFKGQEIADNFFTRIKAKRGFNEDDIEDFFNVFSKLEGRQIAGIMNEVPEDLKIQTRQKLSEILFSPLLDDGATITATNLQKIGQVLGKGEGNTAKAANFTKNQFNALYKGAKDANDKLIPNPYTALEDFYTTYNNLPTDSGIGGLIAAAIGAGIAGIPLALLTGSIGITGALALGTKAASIGVIAKSMGDPDFLKLLAEPRFPDMKSWQLTRKSERFEMYLAQLSHTLRNAVREQQDDAERRSIGAGLTFQGAREQAPSLPPAELLKESLTSLSGPTAPAALQRSARGLVSSGYTNLPNVQSFNIDTDIYQELNRRKALAGNNPNTQALVDRNR